jgi:hypothetical protein
MAIAGLIIGILGLIGALVLYVSAFAFTDQLKNDITSGSFPFPTIPTSTFPTSNLQMGQASPPFYALAGGRITVYSLRVGVSGEDPSMRLPPTGETFAVANVKECAGAHAVNFADAQRNFTLAGPNDVSGQEVHYPDFIQRPVFDSSNLGMIAANRCVQGLVGFMMYGNSVTQVIFPGGSTFFSWSVPQT